MVYVHLYIADAVPVLGSGYVIHNVQPDDSSGRTLTVALYKGEYEERPLVSKQCRVGSYVTLTGTDKLYFGVMNPSFSLGHKYIVQGEQHDNEPVEVTDFHDLTLIPDTEFLPLTEVELFQKDYNSDNPCLEITLKEDQRNGQFTFEQNVH